MVRKPIANPRSKIACSVADSVSPQEMFSPRPRLRLRITFHQAQKVPVDVRPTNIIKCETTLWEIGLFNLLKHDFKLQID